MSMSADQIKVVAEEIKPYDDRVAAVLVIAAACTRLGLEDKFYEKVAAFGQELLDAVDYMEWLAKGGSK